MPSEEELRQSSVIGPDGQLRLPPPADPFAVKMAATPTSAEEWGSRRAEGFTIQLPSGRSATVRRTLNLFEMLRTGRIPNRLAAVVTRMIDVVSGGGTPTQDQLKQMTEGMKEEEALQDMLTLVNEVTAQVMLKPRCVIPPRLKVVEHYFDQGKELTRERDETDEEYNQRAPFWDPPAGVVSVFDVEIEDKMYLFQLSQGGTADAGRFRDEQATFVAAMADGPGVGPEAEQPAGSV